jgi:teichuronic acid biosynthesis glycosyltransferase TuaG
LQVLLKNPFVTPSFMVRRDLALRFLPGRRHMEDHLFLMQVATKGWRIARTRSPLAYIYKNLFGDAGLSVDLWAMERCELDNYELLYREQQVSWGATLCLKTYSRIKFVRRIVIVMFRRACRDPGIKRA